MSDNLPSPFTVASKEDQGWQRAEEVPPLSPPPQNYTLLSLLSDLRHFAEVYQRDADQIRRHDPIIQRRDWIQIGAFVSHARESLLRIPGFNELRTFAITTWGEEITLPVCRRILGTLVQRSHGTLSVAVVEKMTLAEAAFRLTPTHDGNELHAPETTDGAGQGEKTDAADSTNAPLPTDKIRVHHGYAFVEAGTVVDERQGKIVSLDPVWQTLADELRNWKDLLRPIRHGFSALQKLADAITEQYSRRAIYGGESALRLELLRRHGLQDKQFENEVMPACNLPMEYQLLVIQLVRLCQRIQGWLDSNRTCLSDAVLGDLAAVAQTIDDAVADLDSKEARGQASKQSTAELPRATNSGVTALPDGPFEADGFLFQNVEVRFGRAVKQRSLVLALWDVTNCRPRDARPIEDVLTEVYGEDHDTEDAAFRQLCADTRRRIESVAISLTIETSQGYVQFTPRPL
jgi:hypothetical protein